MKYNAPMTAAETAELREFCLSGSHERRDLTTGGASSVFIPEAFNRQVFEAMRAYDAIFDDRFSTVIESTTGGPLDLFVLDDSETAAIIVGEGSGSSEVDPTLFKVQLPQAPVWDSKTVAISYALLQDSAVDLPAMLAKALGIRLARGIGESLITTLLSEAVNGVQAQGDPNGNGAMGSVGYRDLLNLRTAVDPAYRQSGKCNWLMSDDTLALIDGMVDGVGHPMIRPEYQNGQRLLLGFPVGICPSMSGPAPGEIPVLFGATGYFAVRVVKDGGEKESGRLIRIVEAPGYIENLLVGFKSFLRVNGGLLAAQAGSPQTTLSPVMYLQNPSS